MRQNRVMPTPMTDGECLKLLSFEPVADDLRTVRTSANGSSYDRHPLADRQIGGATVALPEQSPSGVEIHVGDHVRRRKSLGRVVNFGKAVERSRGRKFTRLDFLGATGAADFARRKSLGAALRADHA